MGTPSAVLPAVADDASEARKQRAGFLGLAVGCIGVAYGDIGTSPLYAFREAVEAGTAGGAVTREVILGVVSLILWALILIVTVKYVLLLLNADNEGEGGTLSLMALALRAVGGRSRLIFGFGLVGAALFYGDAIITPAISVLSAVEGLALVTPAFDSSVVPVTIAILVALFAVQSRGTGRVAAWFGPITIVWFAVMAAGGVLHIHDDPGVLAAFNPAYAASFVATHGSVSFLALGAVFLAVTGAEALYADLGHFGRRSIRTAWFIVVLPSLALNYLGQGALVLSRPEALENPFFLLYPSWTLLPVVLLATVATVIASQAVITGAFSLSRQAIQLGLLPRLEVRHTSQHHVGQIFIPQVNLLLLLGVLLLVALFTNSSDLAAAYGVAVTGEMVVTALMAFTVVRRLWGWPLWLAAGVIVPLLLLDTVFLAANLLKTVDGGYVPLMFAGLIMTLMITWRRGTRLLFKKTRRAEVPLVDLVRSLAKRPPHRVPGTAVFLTSDPESAPTALLHNLKHNKVLHEHNVVLRVRFADLPHVALGDRVAMEKLDGAFSRVTMSFGYMESPNVPKALAIARRQGWTFDIMSTSFFLSRRKLRPSAHSGMPQWQDRLFIMLARNADDASDYFHIPTGRVVEVGTQLVV